MKLTVLIAIIYIAVFSSCIHKADIAKEKEAMIAADKTFSSLSEKIGVHKAFIQTNLRLFIWIHLCTHSC